MIIQSKPYLFFLLLCLVSSCSTTYIPPLVNAPLLAEKGDSRAGAFITNKGLHLSAAHAMGQHTAFVMDGYFTILPESVLDQWLPESGSVNVGLGFFNRTIDGTHVEFFGGLGWGSGLNREGDEITEDGYYFRFYAQPDLGIRKEKYEFVAASRFSYVTFYNLFREGLDIAPGKSWFIQPSVQLRIPVGDYENLDHSTITIQADFSIPFGGNNTVPFEYSPYVIGLGFYF